MRSAAAFTKASSRHPQASIRGFATVGLAALASFSLSCSSSNFDVAPAVNDTGTANDTSTTADVGGDTPSDAGDPCAPVPNVGKMCIDVLAATPHPSYGSSDATSVNADGHGKVAVYLFDKDPAAGGNPAPIAQLAYPSDGTDIAVPEHDAVTLVSGAVDGTLYVIAVFQDAPRDPSITVLPGDFVSLPVYDAKTKSAAYPPIVVKAGTTSRLSLTLKPVRRVDATYTFGADLWSRIEGVSTPLVPQAHGDGPILYMLYDGDLSATSTIDDVGLTGCVDFGFKTQTNKLPPQLQLSFGTAAPSGAHNIFASLVDYGLGTPFPGAGSFVSDTTASVGRPVPSITLSDTSWLATPSTLNGAITFNAQVPGDSSTQEQSYAQCMAK